MTTAYFQIGDNPVWGDTSILHLEQQSLADKLSGLHQRLTASPRPSTSIYQTHKKHVLTGTIGQLAELEENWDGEGACPIAPAALERAIALVSVMTEALPLPEISPNPNGTVSLYWIVPHGSAELEIGRTRHSWALADMAGKVTTLCSGDNRALDLPTSLIDLLAALAPADMCGTNPLTRLVMRHEWNETSDCL